MVQAGSAIIAAARERVFHEVLFERGPLSDPNARPRGLLNRRRHGISRPGGLALRSEQSDSDLVATM